MRRMVLLLALLLVACAGAPEPEPVAEELPEELPDAAEAVALTAVATVFPLAWLAEQTAPDAEVVFLGARGQDPHDLELSPGQRALLEEADVLLYVGDIDFQPQVERAAATAQGRVVAVAEIAGAGRLRTFDHDHDDDHGHDDDHDEEGDAIDPHVWFDPAVMVDVAVAVGDAFADADPDRAEDYRERAGALRDELVALEGEIDALLAGCRYNAAIVSHEAYAYLLEPRGLHQEGISGAGGHAEASPQRLATLVERIRAEQIPAVLAEPIEGRADAEALAAEAGVPLLEIDPLEIVTDEQHERGYPTLLREQAEAFATALDCS